MARKKKPPRRAALSLLDVNPHTAAPVSAALMFLKAIVLVLSPLPRVGMHDDLQVRLVVNVLANMPAIAFGVAGNVGHRARRRKGDCSGDSGKSSNLSHDEPPLLASLK